MRNSPITEFLNPIDKNKIQAEHLKRIGRLKTRCRRLEKEKTLPLKQLDEIRRLHEIRKISQEIQKKQKQENSNQLPAKQEFKSVPAEKVV